MKREACFPQWGTELVAKLRKQKRYLHLNKTGANIQSHDVCAVSTSMSSGLTQTSNVHAFHFGTGSFTGQFWFVNDEADVEWQKGDILYSCI